MTDTTDRTPDAAAWDERYGASDQIWSGDPNGALVAEVADLPPGPTARRALDVGCGEGADAVWLARRGWQVTALDVSRVALDRAERHARDAGVEVTWVHAGLVEADLPVGGFDLVSAQYPVLLRTPGATAERTLADLVAPGGTLLVVHHDLGGGHDGDEHDVGEHGHGSPGDGSSRGGSPGHGSHPEADHGHGTAQPGRRLRPGAVRAAGRRRRGAGGRLGGRGRRAPAPVRPRRGRRPPRAGRRPARAAPLSRPWRVSDERLLLWSR